MLGVPRLLLFVAGFFIYPICGPAHAEFRVCNQTLNLFNVAVGAEIDHVFSTEGWWTLPANSCVSPIKDDLQKLRLQYVYIYAMSITGEDVLHGDFDMCIKSEKFKYKKLPTGWDCWVKGYQQVKFAEVDTGKNSRNWTVFIQESRDGGGAVIQQ